MLELTLHFFVPNSYVQVIKNRLQELGLNQGLYADVHFLLDDGSCPAHRPLLMARCDVMEAMFAGDFRESSAKVVKLNDQRMFTNLEELINDLILYCKGANAWSE